MKDGQEALLCGATRHPELHEFVQDSLPAHNVVTEAFVGGVALQDSSPTYSGQEQAWEGVRQIDIPAGITAPNRTSQRLRHVLQRVADVISGPSDSSKEAPSSCSRRRPLGSEVSTRHVAPALET